MTTKITVSATTLCELLGGHFTLEACEALCKHFEDIATNDFAPSIGDIACSYGELPGTWTDSYDDENLIAKLDNGNVLVAY